MIFLDTMTLLYYFADNPRLPASLRAEIISNPSVYVSTASIWEIGIKGSLGKLGVGWTDFTSSSAVEKLVATCKTEGFGLVPISDSHACTAPFLSGPHKDPFDRMIVAQALERDATLLSSDAALDSLSPALRRRWADSGRKPPKSV